MEYEGLQGLNRDDVIREGLEHVLLLGYSVLPLLPNKAKGMEYDEQHTHPKKMINS